MNDLILWSAMESPTSGDVVGLMFPKVIRWLFWQKTGIESPHPFTVAISNEGDFIMTFTKDYEKGKFIWIRVDDVLDCWLLNKRAGTL